MDKIYVLVPYGGEWEDLVIFTTEKEAIDASITYSGHVEIFHKTHEGYKPTYIYYKDGELERM